MKIYNEVVIDIATGKTISEDSYEYDGPLMLLNGNPNPSNPADWGQSENYVVYTVYGNGYRKHTYLPDSAQWTSRPVASMTWDDEILLEDWTSEQVEASTPDQLGFTQWDVSTASEWKTWGGAPTETIGEFEAIGEPSLGELTQELEPEEWMGAVPGGESVFGGELTPFPSGDITGTEAYQESPFVTGYGESLADYLDLTFGQAYDPPGGTSWGEAITPETTQSDVMLKAWEAIGVDPEYRSYAPDPVSNVPGGVELEEYWNKPQLGMLGEQLRGAAGSPLVQTELGAIGGEYAGAEYEASEAFLPGYGPQSQYEGAYGTAALDEQTALNTIQETRDVSAEEARNIYEDMRLRGLVGEEGSLQVDLETELAGLEGTAESAISGPGGYLSTMGAEELGWEEKMAGWETKLDVGQTDKERRMDLIKEEANVGSQKASEGLLGVRLSELAESYARGGAKFGAPVSVAEQDIREQRVLELKGYATERGISGENWSTMLEEYGFEETDDGIAPIITDDGGYVPGSIVGLAAEAREAEEQGALQTALSALSTGGYTAEGYGTDLESLYAYLTADDADWTAEQIAELIQPMGWDPITQQYSGEVGGDVALALGEYQSTLETEQADQLAAMRQLGGYWDPVTQEFVEYGEFSSAGTDHPDQWGGIPSYEFTDPVTGLPASMNVGFPEGGWEAANIGQSVLESRQLQDYMYGEGGTLEAPTGGTLGQMAGEYGLWQAPGAAGGGWELGQEGTAQQTARQSLGTAWDVASDLLTTTGAGKLQQEWGDIYDPMLGGWFAGTPAGSGGWAKRWTDLYEAIQ